MKELINLIGKSGSTVALFFGNLSMISSVCFKSFMERESFLLRVPLVDFIYRCFQRFWALPQRTTFEFKSFCQICKIFIKILRYLLVIFYFSFLHRTIVFIALLLFEKKGLTVDQNFLLLAITFGFRLSYSEPFRRQYTGLGTQTRCPN